MDAAAGIPGILSLYVFNAVNEIGASVGLALAEVLGNSKNIVGHSLVVLNGLLDDNCLGEGLLVAFAVKSEGSAVEHLLLSIAESVLVGVNLPLVLPLLLLTRSEVAMGLPVERGHLRGLVVASSLRIEDVFSILQAGGRNSELDLAVFGLLRPLIAAREALT